MTEIQHFINEPSTAWQTFKTLRLVTLCTIRLTCTNSTFCPRSVVTFHVHLRNNSDCSSRVLTCFYNAEVCLLHDAKWKFRYQSRLLSSENAYSRVRSPVSPCGICGGQWHWDIVSLPVLRFSPVNIIPPNLHTHFHCRTALTKKRKGRSLDAFKKYSSFVNQETLDTKVLPLFNFFKN